MQILFVHQNFPGQYRYLARHFAADSSCDAWAIGERANVMRQGPYLPREGLRMLGYDLAPQAPEKFPGSDFQAQLVRAYAVAALALRQQKEGLDPDVICSHPGWGDSLYLKEVFPRAKFLSYFEYFHRPDGPLINFDPEFPTDIGGKMSIRSKNAMNLLTLDMADVGVCPTQWQWSTFPPEYRARIRVIHDGVDTALVAPRPGATFTLNADSTAPRTLTDKHEIITFSVRNLEPSRGFHLFMRALPRVQQLRPNAITVIIGGDEVSYGSPHPSGKSWREVMLDEVGADLDMSRVFFSGKVPYHHLLNLFSITSLHIYLTTPFVLSWSMLEAMACGATVLASATQPVTEFVEDGINGFLFDYGDIDTLAHRANELLDQPLLRQQIGSRARESIIERYDLESRCLPQHIRLIEELLG